MLSVPDSGQKLTEINAWLPKPSPGKPYAIYVWIYLFSVIIQLDQNQEIQLWVLKDLMSALRVKK